MTAHPGARRLLCALLLAALVPLSGCSRLSGLQFRQDDRLQIQAPANLSTVRFPIEVSWQLTGTPPPGRYAVFFDRYPMAPGESLRDIVDTQPNCRGTDECLQPAYLGAVFGIHVTTETSVTIERFPSDAPATGDSGHYATIVLIDDAGYRVGESVWYVSFQVAS
ncbi:hypothetical protein ABT120_55535 [Nonomuraea angiospora]|uniref:hypothetical protein n=1 Tax=Nonomuraea angiospora TaxID=46172 RepID=UPI00331FFB80